MVDPSSRLECKVSLIIHALQAGSRMTLHVSYIFRPRKVWSYSGIASIGSLVDGLAVTLALPLTAEKNVFSVNDAALGPNQQRNRFDRQV
jgi:hypothetical protein